MKDSSLPPSVLEFIQEGSPRTTIQLSFEEGRELRELVEEVVDCRFTTYCERVGIEHSNMCNYLSGGRKISYDIIQRFLSGTPYSVECHISFSITKDPSKIAQDVDSAPLEEEWFSEEEENAQEEQ